MGEHAEKRLWWIVTAIAAIGFALRLAAARGGLWLDEAWSAAMAQQAATPLGVFLNIHHDNNHHLNTLWLQLVGIDAPSWLQRGLSIATGTATILIAARIGARRSAAVAIVAAGLFSLSPILVTYGSEARGYAPMLLAFMVAALLVDRWIGNPDAPAPAIPLAIAALLGLLSHVTMAFGLAALGLWVAWTLRRRRAAAIRPLLRLFLPAAITALATLALIFLPGVKLGASDPFTLAHWASGLWQAQHYAFGHAYAGLLILIGAALVLGLPLGRLAALGYAALLTAPLTVLLTGIPNAGVARLYLTAVAGLLLLLALMIANGFARGHRRRAALALAATLAVMALGCIDVIRDRRADPDRALAAIAARAPGGADAATDHPRSEAILHVAAARGGYPLTIRQGCPAARFLFVERDGTAPFPAAPAHCGTRYRAIAGDRVQALSGTQWKLYERGDR